MQRNSRYFPEIDLQEMINQCLQAARDRGTGVAMRELREIMGQRMG
ncbi:hypothetical protein [Limnofasciculus baicalensis]|uniref:Uncharacterized protein n=1 Tax=Limnofasciculus baicalensis BBK-W-15 TaxID=2699891 RepID=A0AAE3KP72_9CYAN|nr:hypothetical protein [Limnofasciculus baicalensis]MCP2729388.1 hypothetical protein [Limnofasciculus baicalensis BBK-W-15]